MLFGYPLAATTDNWLHECLCGMIRSIHASLQDEEEPPRWPQIIPERYRNLLRGRVGLRERLDVYRVAVQGLSDADRHRVLQALNDQNEIALLLSGARDCDSIRDLPLAIREPVKELFGFAFKLLTDFGVRDNQYRIIYDTAPYHVCPFCGCEYFDAPGAPREALDHYLAESTYPFAAANLRNLVPMGNKCNSCYKLAQDILWREDGTRRISFDPYNHTRVDISLESSQPFAGENGELPRWQVDIVPNTAEAATWDEVFHIRQRYVRDVLNPSFKDWLKSFGDWFKNNTEIDPVTDHDLLMAIRRYADNLELMGLSGREFLRARVFRMLQRHCQLGNQRLIALIRDVVAYA